MDVDDVTIGEDVKIRGESDRQTGRQETNKDIDSVCEDTQENMQKKRRGGRLEDIQNDWEKS